MAPSTRAHPSGARSMTKPGGPSPRPDSGSAGVEPPTSDAAVAELAGVADVLALDHEDDQLAQVGGVVADPLQVLGDRLQTRGPEDVARIFHHVGQELAEDLGVVGVDVLVARDHPLGP